MQLEITDEQIAAFSRDGFLVLPDVLDAAELETWRAEVCEAVETRLRDGDGRHNQSDAVDPFYKDVFVQALNLSRKHPGVRRLVYDPGLGRLAALLAQVAGVRFWHDQALIKAPYANQTTWHRDTPYWSVSTRKAINFWFALDDATLENGCLWYLPGTHLLGDFTHVEIGSNMTDLFRAYPEWKSLRAHPTPCSAGSLVVHNAMTAHAAGANMTPNRRRAMTIAYFPDGETYNGRRDTLPGRYYDTLAEGDLLDDERYVPLIWREDRAET